jgi:hypothetical protein
MHFCEYLKEKMLLKLFLILGLFLAHGTEQIEMKLLDKVSEAKGHKNVPKQSKIPKHFVVKMQKNMGLNAAWKQIPNVFQIIFAFLGDNLTEIIKLAPDKGWVEVIFRFYVPKTLQNDNYIAPAFLWKNNLDFRALQIKASEYIIFDYQLPAFVPNRFQELQMKLDNVNAEIAFHLNWPRPIVVFFLMILILACAAQTQALAEILIRPCKNRINVLEKVFVGSGMAFFVFGLWYHITIRFIVSLCRERKQQQEKKRLLSIMKKNQKNLKAIFP